MKNSDKATFSLNPFPYHWPLLNQRQQYALLSKAELYWVPNSCLWLLLLWNISNFSLCVLTLIWVVLVRPRRQQYVWCLWLAWGWGVGSVGWEPGRRRIGERMCVCVSGRDAILTPRILLWKTQIQESSLPWNLVKSDQTSAELDVFRMLTACKRE